MASSSLFSQCVVVYLLSFFFSSSLSVTSNEKVKLDLYYETLCPACTNFMVNDIPKMFTNGLNLLVDFNLVPYGNARLNNGNITCQHGDYECKLNMVEACAIHAWPGTYKHYVFIYCLENLVVKNKYIEWESCYNKTGYDPKPITNCLNSSMGKQLVLKYANETASLRPPHRFVPWVVVNNVPLEEDFGKFMTFICNAYNGTTPEACKHISSSGRRVEEHIINKVQLCQVE
ncbi:hypothetical protein ACHQM5_027128 [Ranunculus cassubicifolius]